MSEPVRLGVDIPYCMGRARRRAADAVRHFFTGPWRIQRDEEKCQMHVQPYWYQIQSRSNNISINQDFQRFDDVSALVSQTASSPQWQRQWLRYWRRQCHKLADRCEIDVEQSGEWRAPCTVRRGGVLAKKIMIDTCRWRPSFRHILRSCVASSQAVTENTSLCRSLHIEIHLYFYLKIYSLISENCAFRAG